jgi:hypothetical protein
VARQHVVVLDAECADPTHAHVRHPEQFDATPSFEAWCVEDECDWRGHLTAAEPVDFASWMHYEDTGHRAAVLDERDPSWPELVNLTPFNRELDEDFTDFPLATYECHGCGYEHAATTPPCPMPEPRRLVRIPRASWPSWRTGRKLA